MLEWGDGTVRPQFVMMMYQSRGDDEYEGICGKCLISFEQEMGE
jgi:hypothetical protein